MVDAVEGARGLKNVWRGFYLIVRGFFKGVSIQLNDVCGISICSAEECTLFFPYAFDLSEEFSAFTPHRFSRLSFPPPLHPLLLGHRLWHGFSVYNSMENQWSNLDE